MDRIWSEKLKRLVLGLDKNGIVYYIEPVGFSVTIGLGYSVPTNYTLDELGLEQVEVVKSERVAVGLTGHWWWKLPVMEDQAIARWHVIKKQSKDPASGLSFNQADFHPDEHGLLKIIVELKLKAKKAGNGFGLYYDSPKKSIASLGFAASCFVSGTDYKITPGDLGRIDLDNPKLVKRALVDLFGDTEPDKFFQPLKMIQQFDKVMFVLPDELEEITKLGFSVIE